MCGRVAVSKGIAARLLLSSAGGGVKALKGAQGSDVEEGA